MAAVNMPEAVVTTVRPADEVAGHRRRTARRRRPSRSRLGTAVLWALVILFALVFMYPFAWLLAASLKPRGRPADRAVRLRARSGHQPAHR